MLPTRWVSVTEREPQTPGLNFRIREPPWFPLSLSKSNYYRGQERNGSSLYKEYQVLYSVVSPSPKQRSLLTVSELISTSFLPALQAVSTFNNWLSSRVWKSPPSFSLLSHTNGELQRRKSRFEIRKCLGVQISYNMYLWILQYKTSTGLSFSKDKPMPSMEQNTWNVDGRTTLSEDKAEGCCNICEKEGGREGGIQFSSNSNSQYYS